MENIALGGLHHNPGINKFPYWACFIPDPYADYQQPPLGQTIQAGGAYTFPINLQRDDSLYHLLYVKYTAYKLYNGNYYLHKPDASGTWRDFNTHAASGTWQINQNFYWRTWAEDLDCKLTITSGPDRIIYGDKLQITPEGPGYSTQLRLQSMQAQFSGYRVIRTSHLIAKEGSLQVRVTNNSDVALIVNGVTYGYRIYL